MMKFARALGVRLQALADGIAALFRSTSPEWGDGTDLFDYLGGDSSLEDFLDDFPTVSRESAVAVLEAARQRLFSDAPTA
jgi:hypothetical protein